MYKRQDTIPVKVGDLTIGGSNEVIIQSMCTTKTADVEATVAEILRLEEAGCQIVRVTVNNKEAADAIKEIKKRIHIPLVADIHFDYRLALAAIENVTSAMRASRTGAPADVVRRTADRARLAAFDCEECRQVRQPGRRGQVSINARLTSSIARSCMAAVAHRSTMRPRDERWNMCTRSRGIVRRWRSPQHHQTSGSSASPTARRSY